MNRSFLDKIYHAHQECDKCPRSEEVIDFFETLLGLLFPNFASRPITNVEKLENGFDQLKVQLDGLLKEERETDLKKVTQDFFGFIPYLYEGLQKDIQATYEGDPAAKTREEVIRSYPGFYAIAAYRVAHRLHELGVMNITRSITEHAHSRTGIDIHPGAQIGEHFCIDHGTGVVIGETTIIGDHVKIYQGVTLGALSVDKHDAETKRHPTIEDHVVIYAGATILGGNTTIGSSSVIGGNVWLTRSVPPHSKVYYQVSLHQEGESPDLIIIK